MVLVPDLATDLGTPERGLHRVDLHAARRHQVGDRRSDHRRGGRLRHRPLDGRQDVPERSGPLLQQPVLPGWRGLQGPLHRAPAARSQQAVTVDGNTITVKMAKPFPDFAYYAIVPGHRSRSRPTRPSATRRSTPSSPLATGPYKIEQYTRRQVARCSSRNDQWDPATDPARTAYPDGYVFKAGQSAEQIDQILLNDSGDGQDHDQLRRRATPRTTGSSERDRSPGHRRPALHVLLRARLAHGDRQGDRRGADLGRSPTRTRSSPPA